MRWEVLRPTTAETLPHPAVHVVFEERGAARRAYVTGVPTARFVKRLSGCGWVFGIKFRPAMFAPLLRAPVSRLTNLVVPIARVLGPDANALRGAVFAAHDLDARIAIACDFLAPRLPVPPVETLRVRDLVERIAEDPSLVSVEDVAQAGRMTTRTLERAFRRCVGVTPKWVLQRYRLHEAAERLKGPRRQPLVELAASLGYADQAHFARDFKRVTGHTPRAFAHAFAAARRGGRPR